MREIRTYHEIDEAAGREVPEQVAAQRERLRRRLETVGAVVAVASGKGGVGKSALTANLAVALSVRGHRVGAVDADLNGPSLARMLNLRGERLAQGEDGIVPPRGAAGVAAISMELLQAGEDAPLQWKGPDGDAYLWRGSLETGVLREFLSDVAWGELDVLLVDVPPGTDKILRLLELVPDLDRALLVTTPSPVARSVVARSVRLVRESRPGILALVENMSGFVCPDCGGATDLFPGAEAEDPLPGDGTPEPWARIPFDPGLAAATDRGRPVVTADPDAPSARALASLAERLVESLAGIDDPSAEPDREARP